MDLRDEAIHQVVSLEDMERVRELLREYADWLKVDLCFQGFERELATLPGDYAPPDGRLLLAYHHERPVGCVALRRVDATTGEIKRLYVRSEQRGRRTGRRLVEQVIAAARETGYRRLVLDTLPQMAEAGELYRSMGFHEIPRYYANTLPAVRYFALDLDPGLDSLPAA